MDSCKTKKVDTWYLIFAPQFSDGVIMSRAQLLSWFARTPRKQRESAQIAQADKETLFILKKQILSTK